MVFELSSRAASWLKPARKFEGSSSIEFVKWRAFHVSKHVNKQSISLYKQVVICENNNIGDNQRINAKVLKQTLTWMS